MSYWRRPIWVAEQLETVLFDGLLPRARWSLAGRVIERWHLENGVKMNRKHPTSFWIPGDDAKSRLRPGSIVKLAFIDFDGWSERMWVEVTKVGRFRSKGRLLNEPLGHFAHLCAGTKVKFRMDDIIDIDEPEIFALPDAVEVSLSPETRAVHPYLLAQDVRELPPGGD